MRWLTRGAVRAYQDLALIGGRGTALVPELRLQREREPAKEKLQQALGRPHPWTTAKDAS